ncbi:MAG: HAMP domain-containing histidine kinase [Ruminococcaceae bacterium]|nr:HAMP domain-containing histidine kinase [Oscillospiraceae bacterium]
MSGKSRKTIKSRWMKTILAVTVVILLVLAAVILYSVYTRYITAAELTVRARISSTTDNYFSKYNTGDGNYFALGANDFVNNFTYKDIMEVLVLDSEGNTVASSNAFGASRVEENNDYVNALASRDRTGVCISKTVAGETVLALTYILRDTSGTNFGALRYIVSLEDALDQFSVIALIIVLLFALIIMLITLLGRYFVSSIVQPVEEINRITKVIAKGDFNVRIENDTDDEIGELSDSINEMAGRLGEIERMKNEFVSTVSHEIRTPLTAIKGWGETLKMMGDNPELSSKGLDIIINETSRLSDMVEELLDFSRMQNADLKMNFSVFKLNEVISDVYVNYQQRADSENKQMIDEFSVCDEVLLEGDAAKIRQVLINVIDNALKYTAENAIIKIGLERNKKYVTIYFNDNGKGISARDLPRVKEKFFKADNTVRGTGIGLAVADEIVRKHGGEMNIESEIGTGTTVKIRLPIFTAEE